MNTIDNILKKMSTSEQVSLGNIINLRGDLRITLGHSCTMLGACIYMIADPDYRFDGVRFIHTLTGSSVKISETAQKFCNLRNF